MDPRAGAVAAQKCVRRDSLNEGAAEDARGGRDEVQRTCEVVPRGPVNAR